MSLATGECGNCGAFGPWRPNGHADFCRSRSASEQTGRVPPAVGSVSPPATSVDRTVDAAGGDLLDIRDEHVEWCESCKREHQGRERPVPCQRCGRLTERYHAVCRVCEVLPAA